MTEEIESLRQAAAQAFAACDWAGARKRLLRAREQVALSGDELLMLGEAQWWLGDFDASLATTEEAVGRCLDEQQPRRAAMAAIVTGFNYMIRGEDVVGFGWIGRAQRLLADHPDCPEAGYLCYVTEVQTGITLAFDPEALSASARAVHELGQRHGDANLVALGILGEGCALVRAGRVDEGLALLDEAGVMVGSEDLSPIWVGNLYCNLIAACQELADFRRAIVWTERTSRWLEGMPEAVVFTGVCRVHRAQVRQLTGDWPEAEREAARVCEELAGIDFVTVAEAHYQVAELRRLRGDLAGAEEAYRLAHHRGRDPQPGMALLRLAQGRLGDAAASIRTAIAATESPFSCLRLRAAQAWIALRAEDLETARAAAEEVERLAAAYPSAGFAATAAQTRGAVLLAAGRGEEALARLRDAHGRWQQLGARFDAAIVGALMAQTYELLGDADASAREREAATATLTQLGAAVDAEIVAGRRGRLAPPGGLTERQGEVLGLVAAGYSNREIATTLVISEKTVARHLSNIFATLGISSRTQAAAFAYEHGLAARPHG